MICVYIYDGTAFSSSGITLYVLGLPCPWFCTLYRRIVARSRRVLSAIYKYQPVYLFVGLALYRHPPISVSRITSSVSDARATNVLATSLGTMSVSHEELPCCRSRTSWCQPRVNSDLKGEDGSAPSLCHLNAFHNARGPSVCFCCSQWGLCGIRRLLGSVTWDWTPRVLASSSFSVLFGKAPLITRHLVPL